MPRAGGTPWRNAADRVRGVTIRSFMRMLAIVALALGGLAAPLAAGGTKGQVVAVFPPWWGPARALQAAYAGGPVVGMGPADFVVVIALDGPLGSDRLRHAGAWLLFNASRLAGCFLRTEPSDI